MFDSIELNRILLVSSKIILLNVDGLYFSVHVVEFIKIKANIFNNIVNICFTGHYYK